MADQTVTLRKTRDDLGSRFLGATLSTDGTLTIEGQALGRGVERIFGNGNTEYEWAWTFTPASATALAKSLGCENVLDGLTDLFSSDASANLKSYLDDNGIKYEAWSRIGN